MELIHAFISTDSVLALIVAHEEVTTHSSCACSFVSINCIWTLVILCSHICVERLVRLNYDVRYVAKKVILSSLLLVCILIFLSFKLYIKFSWSVEFLYLLNTLWWYPHLLVTWRSNHFYFGNILACINVCVVV